MFCSRGGVGGGGGGGLGEFQIVVHTRDTAGRGLAFREFSQPSKRSDEAMQTRKKYSIAFIIEYF